jgi:signal transduction histidine kinase
VTTDHGELAAAAVIMVALFTVGDRTPIVVSLPSTAVVIVVIYLTAAISNDVPAFDAENLQLLGWFAAATGAGLVMRSRRAELAAVLRREEDRLERETRSRVDQERLRIAQELHDTVGHTVAAVTVQADAAARVVGTDPAEARELLETIAEVTRSTQREIRATLGMLRAGGDGDGRPEIAPAPTDDDVDRVLGVLSARGIEVRVRRDGDRNAVPSSLVSVMYRILQEAVTNILRHGEGVTEVDVTIEQAPGLVVLAVLDNGAPVAGRVVEPPGHHGLQGMRERAMAMGGTLTTEARSEGGFEVRAMIPTGEGAGG